VRLLPFPPFGVSSFLSERGWFSLLSPYRCGINDDPPGSQSDFSPARTPPNASEIFFYSPEATMLIFLHSTTGLIFFLLSSRLFLPDHSAPRFFLFYRIGGLALRHEVLFTCWVPPSFMGQVNSFFVSFFSSPPKNRMGRFFRSGFCTSPPSPNIFLLTEFLPSPELARSSPVERASYPDAFFPFLLDWGTPFQTKRSLPLLWSEYLSDGIRKKETCLWGTGPFSPF